MTYCEEVSEYIMFINSEPFYEGWYYRHHETPYRARYALLHSALVQHKELQQFKNSPLRHHRSVSHSPWAKGFGRRNPALMLGIALTITRATPTWISYINWFFHVSLLTNQQTNNYHEVHGINEIIVTYYSKHGFCTDQESKITFTIGPQIVWLNKGNIPIPLLYVEKKYFHNYKCVKISLS